MSDALVDAPELAAALAGDDPPIVIDVTVARADGRYASGRERFETEGHVPGALFADAMTELSDAASGLPFTLPVDGLLQRTLGRLGVHPRIRVVVYDRLTGAWAARLWYLLRALGHRRVAVLDGGLAAWRAAGLPLESGGARPSEPVRYDRDLDLSGFVVKDRLRELATAPDAARLVCALRAEEFSGESSRAVRRGHIPGSVNVPYLSLLDDAGRIDRARASALAARLQNGPLPVVLYCGGGVNAAGVALALHVADFDAVTIYDGSLSEWFADPALPLEVGAGMPLP